MSKLVKKSEIREYIKYASGEILLTVIGIIIGLQVHVWTEKRTEKNEVETIVGNLYDEFIQNKENLEETVKRVQFSMDNAKNVISLVGKPKAELLTYNLDSLLAVSFAYKKFNPSQDVINVLIESGRLKLIENDAMRDALYNWASNDITLNDRFTDLNTHTNTVFAYLAQNYSLKDLDYYTSERLLGKSHLKIDKTAIFEDIVFENHLDNEIYYLHSYLEVLKITSGIIDEIVENSKQYR